MHQHRLTNLLDPQDPQDCSTKKNVDDSISADRLIGSVELWGMLVMIYGNDNV